MSFPALSRSVLVIVFLFQISQIIQVSFICIFLFIISEDRQFLAS